MSCAITQTRPYLLASETPLLREQKICDALERMDQEEIPGLDREGRFYDSTVEKIQNRALMTKAALLVGTGAGFVAFCMAPAAVSTVKFISLIAGGMGTMGVSIEGLGRCVAEEKNAKEKLENDLLDQRILRLQDKTRTIESYLSGTSDQVEARQLNTAKDYFSLKTIEMIAQKTNNINVKVKHV